MRRAAKWISSAKKEMRVGGAGGPVCTTRTTEFRLSLAA
jgi:hypothetical protein